MVKYIPPRILLLILALHVFHSHCNADIIDSLKSTLTKAKSDSARALLSAELAYNYMTTSIDSSLIYGREALKFADFESDTMHILNAFNVLGLSYMRAGNYDSSIYYFEHAIDISKQLNNLHALGVFYNNVGIVNKNQGNYEKAIEYYLEGLQYDEQRDYKDGIASKHSNIARILFQLDEYEKSLIQDSIACATLKQLNDEVKLGISYNNIGVTFLQLEKYAKAEDNFLLALNLNRKNNIPLEISRNLTNLGVLNREIGRYRLALKNNLEALKIRTEIEETYAIAESFMNVGSDYAELKQFDKANQKFSMSDSIIKSIQAPYLKSELLRAQSRAFRIQGEYKNALEYQDLYHVLADSLKSVEKLARIERLNTLYETEKKDNIILEQKLSLTSQNEKIFQQRMFLLLAIIFIILLVSGVLIFRQRKKVLEQKLLANERQKKVDNFRFLITGEEKERTRIAQELHDGVNGSLAAIRMVLNSTEINTPDQLTKIGEMIDVVSDEVREISHNMLPGMLHQVGLIETIDDFLYKIKNQQNLKVNFEHYGEFDNLSDSIKLSIYRIIQELLKNVLSHSKATECMIQLINQNHQITLTVEDNGIGFNQKISMSEKSGIGIKNIESRVSLVEGTLDIVSEKGVGTSFNIELPVYREAI